MHRLPPLALYVHMPWCVRKCPYCDFNSHAAPDPIPQSQYVDALIEDLARDVPAAQGRPLTSVFFGGGTPSLFAPEQIARFLTAARSLIPFTADAEVTLETNPGTIERGRFSGYRHAGVNRVSLGAQTFDAEHLRALGRIHGSAEITAAVEELVRAGIENFNLDLMYGLPAQTLQQALRDVETAVALGPTHISHYQLTLEPGTVFYHRPPPLPDVELIWQMQLGSQERLATHGYEQYEVSAYARPARRSRHNLNYWQFGDYIGVGAGAHGKLTCLSETAPAPAITVIRTERVRQPREYLQRRANDRISAQHRVSAADLPFEFMLNALRLIQGFDETSFEARTGITFTSLRGLVTQAQARDLLQSDQPGHWRATPRGQRFLNDLQAIFLPASSAAPLPPKAPANNIRLRASS